MEVTVRLVLLSVLSVTLTQIIAEDLASCDMIDSCTCEMSDSSGQINLRGLGVKNGSDSVFTIAGHDAWLYKYNPCYEFSFGFYYGLAVVQTTKAGGSVYDLGTQESAYFNSTAQGTISIHYTALDEKRTSRVLLICDAGVNTHTLKYVGELVITEYDFILETPCACPGLCDDSGVLNPVGPLPSSSPGDINVNVHNPNQGKNAYMWMDVGGAMTALVFHDFFLVFFVALLVLGLKYAGTFAWDSSEPEQRGFGPSDVTGGPIPSSKMSGDGIPDDSL